MHPPYRGTWILDVSPAGAVSEAGEDWQLLASHEVEVLDKKPDDGHATNNGGRKLRPVEAIVVDAHFHGGTWFRVG